MKLFRRYILAILLILIPTVSVWGAKRNKSTEQAPKTKKTATIKASRNKVSSKRKVAKRAKKRLSKRELAAYRARAKALEQERLEQEAERRARLYLGREVKGQLVAGSRPSSTPILHRFLHSDTTLTMSEVRYLYRNTSSADLAAAVKQEMRIDYLIMQERFEEALSLTLSTLRLMPAHLGLLHRSSTLAHHLNKQDLLSKQVWKMAELMNCISHSGSGKDLDTAYEVLSRADAEAFETLWLDVPAEGLQTREFQSGDREGRHAVAISHRDPKSQKELTRYYKLLPKAINKKTIYNEHSVDRHRPISTTGGDGTASVRGAGANRTDSSAAGQQGHRES